MPFGSFANASLVGAKIVNGIPEPAGALLYASGLLLCAARMRRSR